MTTNLRAVLGEHLAADGVRRHDAAARDTASRARDLTPAAAGVLADRSASEITRLRAFAVASLAWTR